MFLFKKIQVQFRCIEKNVLMTLNFGLNNKIKVTSKIYLLQINLNRKKKKIKLRKTLFKTKEIERKCRR